MWEIPEIPEFNDPENFTAMVTRTTPVEAPWQELAENGVDAAHFRYVHNTEEVPELERYEIDGPHRPDAVDPEVPDAARRRRRPHRRRLARPRLLASSTSAASSTRSSWAATPRSTRPDCEMRFSFTVRKLGDDGHQLRPWVRRSSPRSTSRFSEDKPIWENKAHLVRPALADTDGPFMKFRKWTSQFYAEGIDDSDAGLPAPGQLPGRTDRDGIARLRQRPVRRSGRLSQTATDLPGAPPRGRSVASALARRHRPPSDRAVLGWGCRRAVGRRRRAG